MKSGIYIIESPSGKIYVGSSVDVLKRWKDHIWKLNKGVHHSRHLQNAANKYGIGNLTFTKILSCGNEFLIEYEQIIMDDRKPAYNILPFARSPLGHIFTEAHRLALSKSLTGRVSPNKGKKMSHEQKIKISKSKKGIPMTDATKKNMSNAKRVPVPPEQRAIMVARSLATRRSKSKS